RGPAVQRRSAKAGHPAALLIAGEDHLPRRPALDLPAQLGELARRTDVSGENHRPEDSFPKQRAKSVVERWAREADHEHSRALTSELRMHRLLHQQYAFEDK